MDCYLIALTKFQHLTFWARAAFGATETGPDRHGPEGPGSRRSSRVESRALLQWSFRPVRIGADPIVPEDRILQQRYNKINRIARLGFKPYPHNYRSTHTIPDLRSCFDGVEADRLEADEPRASICGRLTTKRRQGKAGFANLKQGGVQIQIYVRRDEVSEQAFELYKLLDAGDLIGVEGRVFRTRTGELTVRVSDVQFLSKSILPPPEKFHGLQDVEIRYRQRSLDLISNDDVRRTFVRRDKIIRTLRAAFERRDYIEVETPMMQPVYGGALARPFQTHHNALDMDLFLRIAPETVSQALDGGWSGPSL